MDGNEPRENRTWCIETIPNVDSVFRQASPSQREKRNGERFPKESFFSLRDDEDGLSSNWSKYTDPEMCYKLISVHCNSSEDDFLDYEMFRVFQFNVGELKSFDGIIDVTHDPIDNGNPAPICSPNNRAHSIIEISPTIKNDPEFRLKLSDYYQNRISDIQCDIDINSLEPEINRLRERTRNNEGRFNGYDWDPVN